MTNSGISNFPKRLSQQVLPVSWAINVLLLIATIAWLYFDARSLGVVESILNRAGFPRGDPTLSISVAAHLSYAAMFVIACGLNAAVTMSLAFAGLLVGPNRFRTIRSWALFTTLTCGWLALFVLWPEIYWNGQQRRVARYLPEIESIVKNLNSNWPQDDGESDALGAYLAYPKSGPRTLLLMGNAAFPDTPLRVSAVERTETGALSFELSGAESGAWLKWRPNDDPPESFLGGLQTYYNLTRSERLAPHWFLVRYFKERGGATLKVP